jgi:hypothetical protein
MPIVTRVDSIDGDIDLLLGLVKTAAQAVEIAQFARKVIADVDATNRTVLGRIPPPIVTVDGSRSGSLEGVKLDGGVITAEWEVIGDVLVWIGETLRERSPIGPSGHYRDAHTLFADGVEIPIGLQVPPAREYVFLNPVPYARKIEIGKTKAGRDFVIQVPNRIYERTATDARARFGNVAAIRDVYRAPLAGQILKYVPIRGPRSRIASSVERGLRVPAIVVTLLAA